ncbi:hypothetical protein [Paracidovorax cattleyae]|uniref:Uncharacterized protein n=1 Tax=Paracidovorax cattleyae TaxID=80868 RepID=A0A1H0WEU1_9BURK|nr:hypothetical protein [Paracidovorax cattleyae]SDP88995.1 hypothetical protein SAMN04489708_1377 [Paracidovorax cattleyae]
MHDVHHIRKLIRWGIPLYLGLVAGALLMTRHALVPMVQDIMSRAPVVRITPGMHLMPFIVAFGSLAIVVMVMRAIPCRNSLIKKFELAANLAVAVSTIALMLKSPPSRTTGRLRSECGSGAGWGAPSPAPDQRCAGSA